MKPSLSFKDINKLNDLAQSTLEIHQNEYVDLLPFFKDVFSPYAYSDSNLAYVNGVANLHFRKRDLHRELNFSNSNVDLVDFFNGLMIRSNEFSNGMVLRHFQLFDELYAGAVFTQRSDLFVLTPLGSLSVKDLEGIANPSYIENKCEGSKMFGYSNLPDISARGTTLPYDISRKEEVENKLGHDSKPILLDYGRKLPKADIYHILSYYNLPTAHLELVLKKTE